MDGLLNVHTKIIDPNTGEEKLVKVEPYLRLKSGEAPTPLFLKKSQVCDENGRIVKPVPGWLWQMASSCSDAALREVGFDPEVVRNLNTREDGVETDEAAQPVMQEENASETQSTQSPPTGDWRARAKARRAAKTVAGKQQN